MSHSSLPQTTSDATLLGVTDVAELLHCSSRHVRRLSDSGRLPKPIKLGALVRWRRCDIEAWVAEGCPVRAAEKRLEAAGI